MLFMLVTVVLECLGEKDSVVHGCERVVHGCASAVVQLYWQSW